MKLFAHPKNRLVYLVLCDITALRWYFKGIMYEAEMTRLTKRHGNWCLFLEPQFESKGKQYLSVKGNTLTL